MSTQTPALPSNPSANAGTRILGATIVTTCIATIAVAMRFYVRGLMIRAIGRDDYVMLLALALVSLGASLNDKR